MENLTWLLLFVPVLDASVTVEYHSGNSTCLCRGTVIRSYDFGSVIVTKDWGRCDRITVKHQGNTYRGTLLKRHGIPGHLATLYVNAKLPAVSVYAGTDHLPGPFFHTGNGLKDGPSLHVTGNRVCNQNADYYHRMTSQAGDDGAGIFTIHEGKPVLVSMVHSGYDNTTVGVKAEAIADFIKFRQPDNRTWLQKNPIYDALTKILCFLLATAFTFVTGLITWSIIDEFAYRHRC